MKRIIISLFALVMTLCANASTDVTTLTDAFYFKNSAISTSENTTLDLMIKTSQDIQTAGAFFYFPEGVRPVSIKTNCELPVAGNFVPSGPDGVNYYIVLFNFTDASQKIAANTEAICAGKVEVEVDPEVVKPGTQISITVKQSELVGATTIKPEDITSDMALQRAAVIDPMEDGYALEIVPFVAQNHGSQKTLSIRMKNAAIIKGLEFDIELPKGLLMCDTDNEWETTEAKINTAACTNTTQDNVKNTNYNREGQPNFVHVAFNGAYSSKTKKYINPSQDYQEIFTLNTYVACDDDYFEKEGEDYWPRSIYELENGVNTLKLSNIVMTDKDNNIHTGSYSASVFAGNTTSDANPILYGNYTSDVVAALAANTDVKAMLSNDVASVDVTAATIDGDASALFNGNLVYAPTKTSYSRTTGEWGSICLPIALENNENISYYEVKELNIAEGKVVLGKITGTLEANTPAFYNTKAGSISAEAEGYLLAESPSTAAELVGVYEKTTLAPNAGYYISGGKLYNDGATVKPFRAYLNAPTTASKELKIFVDESTGLRDVTAEFPAEAIYNLQGMKLQQTQRGINIIGGKKVLIKK